MWTLAAVLFDRDKAPKVLITYVAAWLVILAALRLWRCIWILEQMISLKISNTDAASGAIKHSGAGLIT